jgi:glutamate-1-semialdehyde 2,1-aminomutase
VSSRPVPRDRLEELLTQERDRFRTAHTRSAELLESARRSLLAGVPMTWMAKWPGGHPLFVRRAEGARIEDVDGHAYVDFCLGDTGSMAGHVPAATAAALTRHLAGGPGITTMLPTEDAAAVGDQLADRFGVPLWSFALSATDANRWALRLCRALTGRAKILVFDGCYHGTVDETFAVLGDGGEVVTRPGNVGPAFDVADTTRVAPFNDLEALRRELAAGDVACVLMEPALTNIGIVLPEEGYLDGVRAACDETGTLLINDETHTFSAGYGGCTRAWGLRPDLVVIGKSIGGGVPIGAYGITEDVAGRIEALEDADLVDVGGVGGTLAGNALSLVAARATLEEVLTEDAFARMEATCDAYVAGVRSVLERYDAPWSIVQLGARAEHVFAPALPRDADGVRASADADVEEYLHLALMNRGVLLTPFHNMALMSPATTEADVEVHTRVFEDAVAALWG